MPGSARRPVRSRAFERARTAIGEPGSLLTNIYHSRETASLSVATLPDGQTELEGI